jgi:hypothetical protein
MEPWIVLQYRSIYGSTAVSKPPQDLTWPTLGRTTVRPKTHIGKTGVASPSPSRVMPLTLRDGCGGLL